MSAAEHEDFKASGAFTGSPLDVKDGFIHMSVAAAVRETVEIYFKGCRDTMLCKIDLATLKGEELRWDWVEKRKLHFPHLYGRPLPYSAVLQVWGPLETTEDTGKFKLPEEIP